MARPGCGVNIPSGTASDTAVVTGTISGLLAIAGAYKGLAGALVSVSSVIWAAVAVLVAIVAIVAYFAYQRCKKDWDGTPGCVSGVIEKITPAFTGSTTEHWLPFVSQHDRVDVVVKSVYWDLLDQKSDFVFCSENDASPMMPAFYYDPAVCNAGIGGAVGAAVTGAAGLILAAAAVAAIGCGSIGLCILALIVAVLIVAAAAIIGASAGSQIGKAATDPSDPSTAGDDSHALGVGEYVSITGNMMKHGELQNALVFHFADPATAHGYSFNQPSFSHTDPDEHLEVDMCGGGVVL